MTAARLAARYVSDSVTTMSPAQLLLSLYDRLVLDLDRAEAALRGGQPAHQLLLHAQDIVAELRSSLDVDAWEGGPQLASLYSFFLTELVNANVSRDADRVRSVRELVVPLRDAWREAAVLAAQAS